MEKHSWLKWIFGGLALFSISCSSVKKRAFDFYLRGFQDQKAEGVEFFPPPLPYKKQAHPTLDALWWNPQSGSSISYFSNCSKVQKTLEKFQNDSFPQNSQYKILKKNRTKNSLYSILEILESPHKTYIGVYTIKKGQCYFNINLVTSSHPSFEKEESLFKTFIKGFELR